MLYTWCWWECKLVQLLWRFLKLNIELPYDLAISLLGMYLEKTIIWNDTCTPGFTVALFKKAKTWKQPKCPSTKEWIKKMYYVYSMEYYSAIKKNEIMPFAATWMDIETIILSEVSQKVKDKNHMTSLIMWNLLKMIQTVPIVAQQVMNSTSIHENVGSILSLTQWVKDLVFPRAGV